MTRTTPFLSTVCALALLGANVYAASDRPNSAGLQEATARALVAEREQRVPSDLEVVHRATASFPLLGTAVSSFKVVDRTSGAIFTAALDAEGREIDLTALRADEEAAQEARYGRLDPGLAERLEAVRNGETLDVAIWLEESSWEPVRPEPPVKGDPQPTTGEVDAILAEIDRARADWVKEIAEPVLERLAEHGIRAQLDWSSPVIHARLAPDAIRTVERWAEVDRIYGQGARLVPMLEATRSTVYANTVNHERGQMGVGVKVAQIEIGGRVLVTNPFLSGIVQDEVGVCPYATPHSTLVAGIIRSSNIPQRGIAPGVALRAAGSCSGSTMEMEARAIAAAAWGARVFNLSYGAEPLPGCTPSLPGCDSFRLVDGHARFYDDLVRNRALTVVASAGNNGGRGGNAWVTSPATAFNVITVGNVDDWKTGSWTYPLPDMMFPSSSYTDPQSTHSDREKPEVVAPGARMISTIHTWPFVGTVDLNMDGQADSGTSYSAPVVSGAAALLIGRDPVLAVWPEAVKAILMATAVHNIEGDGRLSEKDGAGAIVLTRADDVTRRVSGDWSGELYSCSAPSVLNLTTVSLAAGQRLRAVIAWDNNPAYARYAVEPSADLDLQLVDSAGLMRSISASRDNTYEIIDTTAPSAGNYTLRVVRTSCGASPGFLGWAWHKP